MASVANAFPTPMPMDTYHMRLNSPGQLGNSNTLNQSQSMQKQQRAKFKLEPMKVLEPSNKKLSLPESQRIMYILDEFIRQLEILDYMDIITSNEEKSASFLRAELTDEERKNNMEEVFIAMCQNHQKLVKMFKEGNDLPSLQNKETVEMLIKSSCKDIMRIIGKKNNWFANFKKETAKIKVFNVQIDKLRGLFVEIKAITNERLLLTPNEQEEKLEYLKELLIREKANNDLITKLREEQNLALADKDKDIQVRNDQIRKLDNDLKNVEKFSTDLVKRTKTDAEQQESSETKASDGRKAKLQQELGQLRQQFQTLVLEHREQEQQLRREKWKHETNVEGLLNKYDDDMTRKQNEYDEIYDLYEEEKKQLYELEEKFKPLEEEYKKIMEERRMVEALRLIQEEALNKKVKAAVVIQSYWRGFKLRKGLFKKAKGKKGKKK